MSFEAAIQDYIARVDRALADALPSAETQPVTLHEAMRYATLNGGKRIRPLLVYATGEVLGITDDASLDDAAVAVELIHAFSLVHDDLPAMDDDDLRRGRPTVHRQFDEATAILAADALQPLAFETLARGRTTATSARLTMVRLLAEACGSLGMTGGQAIDIESEGKQIDGDLLRQMFNQKTGALIRASVLMPLTLSSAANDDESAALRKFSENLGLAFQIRDDILDIEGETEVIGKPAGSDLAHDKATWPAIFGLQQAKTDCERLYEEGLSLLEPFGPRAEPLAVLARRIVQRID
ncbi:MAG: polyprenyl synthetase family protein [Pseudomonadota bacterium]